MVANNSSYFAMRKQVSQSLCVMYSTSPAMAVQWGFVVIASFAAVRLWRRRFLGT